MAGRASVVLHIAGVWGAGVRGLGPGICRPGESEAVVSGGEGAVAGAPVQGLEELDGSGEEVEEDGWRRRGTAEAAEDLAAALVERLFQQ